MDSFSKFRQTIKINSKSQLPRQSHNKKQNEIVIKIYVKIKRSRTRYIHRILAILKGCTASTLSNRKIETE